MVSTFSTFTYQTPDPRTPELVYWSSHSLLSNFNAADVNVPISQITALFNDGATRTIVIEYASARFASAAANIGVLGFVVLDGNGTGRVIGNSWITAATNETNTQRLDWRYYITTLSTRPTSAFLGVNTISNYAAADDIWIDAWGYLLQERPVTTASLSPQPVSLEGYRWPLKRAV